MKISNRDKLLLIGFIGILLAVCSVYFIYMPTMEKADALEAENVQLEQKINDLSVKMAQKDSYIADTQIMKQETEAIYQRFPVDVREEDALLLAINQELISPMAINNVSIGTYEPVTIPDIPEADVDHTYEIDEVEEYEAQEGITDDAAAIQEVEADNTSASDAASPLVNRNITINYLCTYDGLKRGIKNISVQDNRMSIDNLTVVYDETTGLLTGTTSVDMYCVPGQPDKEYVQPNFSSVLLGTDNIFGSIELQSERGLADLEDNEDEEEVESEDTGNE
ncbi:MAG: hypothetical protein PUF03_03575 [Lachnospiraceae bacterium]|nr:hypothetical protein [Lachnospiraceae bacterium]